MGHHSLLKRSVGPEPSHHDQLTGPRLELVHIRPEVTGCSRTDPPARHKPATGHPAGM